MDAIAHYLLSAIVDEKTEIASGLRRREPALLDQLIEKYQHRLLRYLVSLTGNRELAEDFFQETWIRVLERGNQFDGRHEFSAWLFTIARNLVLDQMRRKRTTSLDAMTQDDRPFEAVDAAQLSAFELVARHEQQENIAAAMRHLSPEFREALVLRFQEELSLEEIAGITDAPLSTVKSRIYRGLSTLEHWMKGGRR